jgi:tRNA pseudouridine55 synthase
VIDGLAIVDKPSGMTSHDVVGACRRRFGQKRVGHAGTLDPDATGVLVIGLGRGTRLLQFLSGLAKSYEGEVVLGTATTTLDASGPVTGRWDQRHVTLEDARRVAAELTGTIRQVPPMVSAVKVGGRRLHELARAGIEVERPAREVVVTRFDVIEATTEAVGGRLGEQPGDPERPPEGELPGGPVFQIRVDCSAGTYVRVLAADLGAALGGGAHLRRLRRTAVGPWTVGEATPLDQIGPAGVIPPAAALPWLAAVVVGDEVAADIRHGKVLDIERLGVAGAGLGAGPWPVIGPAGDLLAVYQPHGAGRAKPAVVLAAG